MADDYIKSQNPMSTVSHENLVHSRTYVDFNYGSLSKSKLKSESTRYGYQEIWKEIGAYENKNKSTNSNDEKQTPSYLLTYNNFSNIVQKKKQRFIESSGYSVDKYMFATFLDEYRRNDFRRKRLLYAVIYKKN